VFGGPNRNGGGGGGSGAGAQLTRRSHSGQRENERVGGDSI